VEDAMATMRQGLRPELADESDAAPLP
jgi:hypothetical protein